MFYLQGRGEPLREELDGILRDDGFKLCASGERLSQPGVLSVKLLRKKGQHTITEKFLQ
jgi:hypothetical protein